MYNMNTSWEAVNPCPDISKITGAILLNFGMEGLHKVVNQILF